MAWPRKPPKNTRCDASVPTPADAPETLSPVVHYCQEMATETVKMTWGSVFELWLCPLHVEQFGDRITRNPRLYPKK